MLKLLVGILLLPCVSFAGYKYHSENLALMDIESIQRLVGKSLAAADKAITPNATNIDSPSEDEVSNGQGAEALKDALKLVFARPTQNEPVSDVYQDISNSAEDFGGINKLLSEVSDEALEDLDNSCDDDELECLKNQNTSIFVLINMIEEVKPQLQNGNEDEGVRKILVKIRDEGISYSNALKNHRLLSSNLPIQNPSKAAALVVGKKKNPWWKFWTWFS